MKNQNSLADFEVSGRSLGAIIDGFRHYPTVALTYLQKFGIAKSDQELDRDAWYRLDTWISALTAMTSEVGSNSMYRIGRSVPQNVALPAHITDIHACLASLDDAYRLNHRKNGVAMLNPSTGEKVDGIGRYTYEPVKDANQVICVCDVPYPCDLDRGLIGAMAARFEPTAKIQHDGDAPCRKKGGESCTYVVFW